MGNTDSGIMGEGKAGTEGIADFNPEDIESISILSGPRLLLCMVVVRQMVSF